MKTLALLYLAFIVTVVTGWVMNIVDIINYTGPMGGEFVLRVVGIFLAPLGAFMGLFV
ncbi:hypothetical protein [Mesorhizobium sp.]|uniref:hypothetical protein n=1 Tax=Mesorhizobium sp. TaxID=1871066 RepID=UPI00258083EE|nr:hypothetical protein [Mesorhizobium sp.]